MMATTHVLAGAGIGEIITNPYLSFVTAVITHFIIDKIPHFWPAKYKDQVLLNVFDWTVAAIIILLFLGYPIDNQSSILAGALGGVAVDIVLVGLPYFYNRKVGGWHTGRQLHQREPIFLVTDLLFIVPLGLYFLARS
jgi:hypothetical protein